MKKVITMVMALIVSCLFFCVASAVDYEISSELRVEGVGSFDRAMDARTEYDYKGIDLEEIFYTRFLGTNGGGPIRYSSIFTLYKGNSTQFENQSTAEIEYSQTSDTNSAKHYLFGKNYELGAAAGFVTRGDAIKSFSLFMDPVTEEFDLEAKVDGRIVIAKKVADPATMFVYVDEVTRVDGMSEVAWNVYVERLDYPAGEGDWLGCP